jgi:hypothetical protein
MLFKNDWYHRCELIRNMGWKNICVGGLKKYMYHKSSPLFHMKMPKIKLILHTSTKHVPKPLHSSTQTIQSGKETMTLGFPLPSQLNM